MKKAIITLGLLCSSFFIYAQLSIPVLGDKYHLYGPNSTWGEYLKVGGIREKSIASIMATNGNLHLDSKDGFSLYLNHYTNGKTLINTNGGFVGIGTQSPYKPLHIVSSTENHQIRVQGLNNKHAWVQFYPSGSEVINWQVGANTAGFSIYDLSNSNYKFTVSNAGNIGIGTSTPDPKSGVHMYQDRYTLYGPNSTWGEYLQVGGNGRTTNHASVVATNGNLHIDSKEERALYFNYYSLGNTYLNTKGGSVGIGTTKLDANSKLTVAGKVHAQEVEVSVDAGADFVFEDDYQLQGLAEIENYVKKNKRLPEIPSAAEMVEEGVNLGEMNIQLLRKIEELTLHLIQQNKKIEDLQQEVNALKE